MPFKPHKNTTDYPIRTRRMDIHHPLICYVCNNKIEKGETYYGRDYRETHTRCIDEHEKVVQCK